MRQTHHGGDAVNGNSAAALAQRSVGVRVSHRFGITLKFEQGLGALVASQFRRPTLSATASAASACAW